MRKLRLEFEKTGTAVYISHLDLMRTFQRAFLRARLPIRHTEGFNPHAIISIALPMSVGFSSVCELLDFQLLDETPEPQIAERLNASLPSGIRVRTCRDGSRPTRELHFLRYQIELIYDNGVPEGAAERLEALLKQTPLLVEKKKKKAGKGKQMVETDIAPLIGSIEVRGQTGDTVSLDAKLRAQEPGLNPRYLIQVIGQAEQSLTPDFVRYHRIGVYDEEMRPFL